jgi:hypothetical protein
MLMKKGPTKGGLGLVVEERTGPPAHNEPTDAANHSGRVMVKSTSPVLHDALQRIVTSETCTERPEYMVKLPRAGDVLIGIGDDDIRGWPARLASRVVFFLFLSCSSRRWAPSSSHRRQQSARPRRQHRRQQQTVLRTAPLASGRKLARVSDRLSAFRVPVHSEVWLTFARCILADAEGDDDDGGPRAPDPADASPKPPPPGADGAPPGGGAGGASADPAADKDAADAEAARARAVTDAEGDGMHGVGDEDHEVVKLTWHVRIFSLNH